MKKFVSVVAALVVALTSGVTSANAQTVLVGQVLQSDLVLSKAQSPYLVTGLIQIPAGRTMVVQPGVEVTFASGSGIRAIGDVKIGELGGSERVKITLNTSLHLVGNGTLASTVTIHRADIYGKDAPLVFGCRKLEIVESYLEKISTIVAEQECPSLSIRDSYLKEVRNVYQGFFDGAPKFFELHNNAILSMTAICCSISDRTMGSSDKQAIYKVTNNDFRNLESLNIPWGYLNYTFSGNNLVGLKNLRIVRFFGEVPNSTTEKLSGNYWGPNATDESIRRTVTVVDGKTDIGITKVMTFDPVLTAPSSLSGFPLGRQAELDRATAEKAAAEKAAAEKAAAEKAAAEKAAAEKAAAERAAAEQAAAARAASLVPRKYANCAALQRVYPGGVAKSANWVNKGSRLKLKPAVNARTYNLNQSLDRDKDGLACER